MVTNCNCRTPPVRVVGLVERRALSVFNSPFVPDLLGRLWVEPMKFMY